MVNKTQFSMSLKKQAISGMLWTFAQQFSVQGISFVVSIILARLLLPAEFGLIAMISVFVGLANALISSGMTQSLVRTEILDDDDFSTVFYFNLGVSILMYALIYALAPFIADFYRQELLVNILRVYSIVFVIDALAAIQVTRLTKVLNFKTQMKVAVPSLILSGMVGVGMAFYGFGVWSLVGAALTKSFFNTVQYWLWSSWRPVFRFKMEKFRQHFNYGIKILLAGILEIIFSNGITIIIGRFFLPAQVGFYQRADTLKQLPVVNITYMVDKVAFPLFASIQHDDVRLKNAYKKIMQMVIYLIAPVMLILAAVAEPLFRFLFTEKWLPSVPYFQILCLNGLLFPIHSYNLTILKVKGRSDLFLKLEIVKKIIIAVVILLSIQYGIYGLLYGSVISSVLCFFVNTHYSGKFLDYPGFSQLADVLPLLLLGAAAAAVAFGADFFLKTIEAADIIRLLISGFAGILFYAVISHLFKISSFSELKLIILRK
ncbi:Lipopolysaccharide biosynthesis protein wzxC [Flavobacteriaceae bacterium 3519-10]|nr:Lipopolysaccharide biosynthesis protein wzxC [Flavobacteriaceae bacterium 3519-10]